MKTNQQVYSEFGIQPTDTNLIVEKFGLPSGNHSDEAVAKIRAVYSEAKKLNLTVKKYLATIEVEGQPQAQAPNPRPDRAPHIQAPTDEAAVEDFGLVVRGALSDIVGGSVNVLGSIDNGLKDHEEAFSDAIVARLKQSKSRSARLVVSKLEHEDTAFFQLAPTGAAEAFAQQAAAILALDSGAPQHGYAALKQATVVEEHDQRIEQSIG